jgi:hypothetical protein
MMKLATFNYLNNVDAADWKLSHEVMSEQWMTNGRRIRARVRTGQFPSIMGLSIRAMRLARIRGFWATFGKAARSEKKYEPSEQSQIIIYLNV